MHLLRISRLAFAMTVLVSNSAVAYENPILTGINDPDCVLMDGSYHLIEPEGGGKSWHFNYRTSKDLVHWSDPVAILPQPRGTALWQGSYFRDADGKLYLYYAAVNRPSADSPAVKTVRVAYAKDFTGPFTDLGVVAEHAIDPYPLRAEDGSLWLYYKDVRAGQKGIWVQRMNDPAALAASPAVEILHPRPQTFEDNGYLTVEGPTVIYRSGYYFLLYTGGPFDAKSYAVGYAVAKSPDGPFVRGKNNPILTSTPTNEVYSPGVPTVVEDGAGKSWLVYRQRATAKRNSPRDLTIDPLDDSRAASGVLNATATGGNQQPDPVPLP